MSKSPGLKPFNHFLHWCRKEPAVVREYKDALDEFIGPFLGKLRAQGAPASLEALVEDWIYLERSLTSCKRTPLELYLRLVGRELAPADRKACKAFLDGRLFGFFRIEAVEAGRGLRASQLWSGSKLEIRDAKGSDQAEPGLILLARVLPFKDHWILPSFVTALPKATGDIEKTVTPEAAAMKPFSHRDALALLLGASDEPAAPLDATQAGARLASILERWGASVSASDIQRAIEEAHRLRGPMKPLTDLLTRSAPTTKEANEALQALSALWNALLPTGPGGAPGGPGPVEKTLIRSLSWETAAAIRKTDFEDPAEVERISREIHDRWLDTPLKDHDGRTPRQVILEERAALGNPETRIRYLVKVEKWEAPAAESAARDAVEQANAMLQGGDPARALPLYEKAYSALKREPEVYRVLGNMAGCHIQLGDREKAVDLLRAALRVNPDYAIARNNLHLLESMTDAEFRKQHQAGFFKKHNIVR